MDQDTREAINLVWTQGINVIREDLKDVTKGISSFRKWIIGLVITAIPAYLGAFITIVVILAKR